jgi:DNA-damage-inducible protein D
MKREIIDRLCTDFERLVHVEEDTGVEFWLARELQIVLGYDRWENFPGSKGWANRSLTA